MAYLNNVEYIVFIGLFENASGDLTKKKKPDLNVFLIQKQRRIHSTFANIHIHRISLILNAWLKRDAKLKVIFWSSKQSLH
jgi:hypothetical protein